MGKEPQQQPNQSHQAKDEPKKIIKKIPFKAFPKNSKEDDIKDWKPMKISETVQLQKKELQKEKSNLAENFLMTLPKPKATQPKEARFTFDEKILFKPKEKAIKKAQPTAEQIKWDIQDQTFIKKEFENRKEDEIEHKLVQEDDGEIAVDKIQWLNEDKPKMKQIDITKAIDKNWQAENVKKSQFQSEIWNSKLLEGKGQLSEFVKQAINKFDQDELTINRHNLNKKNIRSRYGW